MYVWASCTPTKTHYLIQQIVTLLLIGKRTPRLLQQWQYVEMIYKKLKIVNELERIHFVLRSYHVIDIKKKTQD